MPEMFTTDEAADYLGVSRRTLERLVLDGRIEHFYLGASRGFYRDELDAYRQTTLQETGAP